ncbi:hypothetical protein V2J09_013752 [Rumex salicifolius]
MCPLRFILVFFSAILAGYFAWRSFGSSPGVDFAVANDSEDYKASMEDDQKQEKNMRMMIVDGFWVFVDMASGRYLWRNFKEMKKGEKVN